MATLRYAWYGLSTQHLTQLGGSLAIWLFSSFDYLIWPPPLPLVLRDARHQLVLDMADEASQGVAAASVRWIGTGSYANEGEKEKGGKVEGLASPSLLA